MLNDEKYMQRCIDLAKLGQGNVAPNPMVGSVVVYKDKIIGEGYHQQYGEAHAEVNAINAVANKSHLKDSTIYINLEPCAHFGKTPPCADLIIDSGIPNVVIGCVDSYSEVAGKGIQKMIAAGANVRVSLLEEDCLELNKRFFTYHTHKRPYIILKWAQTASGFIDRKRADNDKGIFWITAPTTKVLTHKWRHEEAAILIGKNTVKNDNPSLTCRAFNGNSPIRFIIDQNLHLDYGAFKVGDRNVPTYVFTNKPYVSKGNLQFIKPESFDLKGILKSLYELQIQSVIIEGGKTTLQHFIEEGIWDEARILTGKNPLKDGVLAPKLKGNTSDKYQLGTDTIEIILND